MLSAWAVHTPIITQARGLNVHKWLVKAVATPARGAQHNAHDWKPNLGAVVPAALFVWLDTDDGSGDDDNDHNPSVSEPARVQTVPKATGPAVSRT